MVTIANLCKLIVLMRIFMHVTQLPVEKPNLYNFTGELVHIRAGSVSVFGNFPIFFNVDTIFGIGTEKIPRN